MRLQPACLARRRTRKTLPFIEGLELRGLLSAGFALQFDQAASLSGQEVAIVAASDGGEWAYSSSGQIEHIGADGSRTYFAATGTGEIGGIAAGPGGSVWFSHLNTIGRIAADGTMSGTQLQLDANDLIDAIAADGSGGLWFIGHTSGLTNAGAYIGHYTIEGNVERFAVPDPADFYAPEQALTVGPDGNVWFTSTDGFAWATKKVDRLTPDGTITEFSVSFGASGGNAAITAGPGGDLWFALGDKAVGRITTDGQIASFPLSSIPAGVTDAADNTIWFTLPDEGKVGRIVADGTVTLFSDAGAGIHPQAIAAGQDGNLWFTLAGASSSLTGVGRLDPTQAVPDAPNVPLSVATVVGIPVSAASTQDAASRLSDNLTNAQIGMFGHNLVRRYHAQKRGRAPRAAKPVNRGPLGYHKHSNGKTVPTRTQHPTGAGMFHRHAAT